MGVQARSLSTKRILAMVVMLVLHSGLGLVMLIPPAPTTFAPFVSPPKNNAVRLAQTVIVIVLPRPDETQKLRLSGPAKLTQQIRIPANMPKLRRRIDIRQQVQEYAADRSTPLVPTVEPPPAAESYVSGGHAFQGALHTALHPQPNRFASHPDNHSPKLAMIDRDHQGASAVIRAIGEGIFGASDPACVDADTYAGMTDQELIARGVSRSATDDMVSSHDCVPKRVYK